MKSAAITEDSGGVVRDGDGRRLCYCRRFRIQSV